MKAIQWGAVFVMGTICGAIALAAPAGTVDFLWKVPTDSAQTPMVPKALDQLKLTLPLKFPQTVTVAEPATPSSLLGIAVQDAQLFSWRVLDLTTGKMKPGITAKMTVNHPVLSPGGKYLAAVGADAGALLQIWPIGNPAGTSVSDHRTGSVLTPIAFRGADDSSLVCSTFNPTGGSLIVIVDPATGTEKEQFPVPITMTEVIAATSPNGKLLATVATGPRARSALYVIDLDAKVVAGMAAATPAGKMTLLGPTQGIAFSEDGKEIAALFGGANYRVMVWDVATGKMAADVPLKISVMPGSQPQGCPLQLLADGKGLRVFQYLVDRATGETLQTVPMPAGGGKNYGYVRMTGAAHAIVVDEPPMFGKESHVEVVRVGE